MVTYSKGGVIDKGEKEVKEQLGGLIAYYCKVLPDASRTHDDLWKFAKMHDRRSYQLIRFCMAPDSDYRKVYKSIVSLKSSIMRTTTKAAYRKSLPRE